MRNNLLPMGWLVHILVHIYVMVFLLRHFIEVTSCSIHIGWDNGPLVLV